MVTTTPVFLTHAQLVSLFKGGFCYSIIDQEKFYQGIDEYIVPSTIKDLQFRVPGMGVKANAKDLASVKEDFSSHIKKEFWDYFSNKNSNVSFGQFHEKVCNYMVKIFSERYNNVSYGKAQKAINMIFKYFYCFDGCDRIINNIDYKLKFVDCHMPLDSKILEWYRKEIDSTQKTPWSYLDKDEYDMIQKKIKDHINLKYNGKYTVLQAEFVIWDNAINSKGSTYE